MVVMFPVAAFRVCGSLWLIEMLLMLHVVAF